MSTEQAPSERVVKRYGNRKLYDTATRRYVTLQHLAGWVADGAELRVVDAKSGEDLTTVTLAQVILEMLKEKGASVPRQVLSRIIRLSAAPSGAWGDWTPQDAAVRAREEAERIATGLVARGRMTLEDALALRQEIAGTVQRAVSEAQSGIESRLRGLLHPQTEVGSTLSGLRDRLSNFEGWLGTPGPAAVDKKRRR